jgi:peptide chain release factor 1
VDLGPHIERFGRRLAEVESALSAPDAFNNPQRAQELSREYSRLKDLVASGQKYLKIREELEGNRTMIASEPAGSELAVLAAEEVARLESEEARLTFEVQRGLLPPDPTDSRNTIIEIRAGAGGAESALFAADLFRMYSRYAEAQGWKVEPMDSSPSDLGGFKDVIFGVNGTDVYRRLKFESGVHRVQRVPATEAQGRIHTSTATVAVLPEAEEVDVEIRPDDLDITVCRASGHGGQGVNTTDSAVRIVHKPTGLEVRCQDERSQLKTGERSEKIRTYNFPQNRVTDHRIELTVYNLSQVIEGAIDEVIEPLLAHDMKERLSRLNKA